MTHPIEAVIEKVSLKPNKIQPIIVDFQHGELKDEEAVNMECGLYRDDKMNKQLLALSNGHVVYKGYRPDPDESLTYTMLAIHNKRTGKVRLVQAERWQVAPVLDRELDDNKDIDKNRIVQLNRQFGSKRTQRRTETMERMKLNVDSVKDQLEKTVAKVNIDRADLSLPSLLDDSIVNMHIPDANRDASRVEDVYNINDIVPQAKLETLYDSCKVILDEGLEGKSQFFEETLKALKLASNSLEQTAMLLYVDAVVAWLNIPIKDAKKKSSEICPYSSDIKDYIIETYSLPSAQGRLRPNSMKDKGIMHCLILALIISNFTLDLNLFTTILKTRMGVKKLLEFSKYIGAIPLKDNKNIVRLKVPLPPKLVGVRRVLKKKK